MSAPGVPPTSKSRRADGVGARDRRQMVQRLTLRGSSGAPGSVRWREPTGIGRIAGGTDPAWCLPHRSSSPAPARGCTVANQTGTPQPR
jgi:hypothetical protein